MSRKFTFLAILALLFSMVLPVAAAPTERTPQDDPIRSGRLTAAPTEFDDAAPAVRTQPATIENASLRMIVRLADAPLAQYAGGIAGLRATSPKATGAAKLDVAAPESESYLAFLAAQQDAFVERLAAEAPSAEVQYKYRLTLNALAVKVASGDVEKLRRLPGVVAVTPEQRYEVQMDASIPLIGLGTGNVGAPDWVDAGLWNTVGGHANAGAGIKVADIDSGLDFQNPCFDATGFTYPAGFPKYDDLPGDAQLVNPKVIAARAYFRPGDPPVGSRNAQDDGTALGGGHGSHTAGSITCKYGTATPWGVISGLAPKAQLMVYRIFYRSVSGSNGAATPEILMALEDVLADGADLVNNSWGGTSINTVDEPETLAFSAAVDAGLVVIFSAGNNGSGAMTLSTPGLGEKFITVGATTTNRAYTTILSAVATTPTVTIPTTVTNITGRSISISPVTALTVDLEVEGYVDAIACNGALPAPLVAGKIVVVQRGTCALVDKVSNAKKGDAVGVVIRNVAGGATTLPNIVPVLPTIHIARADGDNIKTWLQALKVGGVTATFTIFAPAVRDLTDIPDTIASFSSRGPTPDLRIKPDLMAPGVNILSAITNGFDLKQGTSMSAPHVTGAAALLKQLHPEWTPAQIRSALMTTAAEPASLGTSNPTQRGSGRLNLTAPDDPGLTFDAPSVSFGLLTVGSTMTKTITARNVTTATATYTVSAIAASGGFTPTVPASISVPAGGTALFTVVLTAGAAGDAFGKIVLSDGTANHMLHIPYWVRRVANLGDADVLLIDGDNSDAGCTDVRAFYTAALAALGRTYVVWDLNTGNGYTMDFNQARRYSKVIYFTGDAGCGGDLSFFGNTLRNYLAQGGKMLITGQDIAFLDEVVRLTFGASFSPGLFFGAGYVQNNLYASGVPTPTVVGDWTYSNYLGMQMYDIKPGGDGAGNQTSVDEILAKFYSDTDAYPILFSAPTPSIKGLGHLGTRMSSEPTIERVTGDAEWTEFPYRTEFLSFGLEGVNDNTGYNTRAELLDRLLAFLDDQVTVAFGAPSYKAIGPFAPVVVTALAASSVITTSTGFTNTIVSYRWDFGDDTPIQGTSVPTATHGYAALGTYDAYVEVMDRFGHKAVAGPVMVTVSPYKVYAPVILKP